MQLLTKMLEFCLLFVEHVGSARCPHGAGIW